MFSVDNDTDKQQCLVLGRRNVASSRAAFSLNLRHYLDILNAQLAISSCVVPWIFYYINISMLRRYVFRLKLHVLFYLRTSFCKELLLKAAKPSNYGVFLILSYFWVSFDWFITIFARYSPKYVHCRGFQKFQFCVIAISSTNIARFWRCKYTVFHKTHGQFPTHFD